MRILPARHTRRLTSLALLLAALAPASALAQDFRERAPADEVVYFLLPDRFENGDSTNDSGGLEGGPLITGFDPTHKGFFHGGDLAGLQRRLDYLRGLGATAIWVAPIFKNKPVQGPVGQESAGYHGYWVTDFTSVDPHLGSDDEFRALVDAAHAAGMKVYMDIITNHTADVIQYREAAAEAYPYRSKADYPYSTRGGPGGEHINEGFAGDDVQTAENFARLVDPDYAYTPYAPKGEEDVKRPAWLNDLTLYHNRGNTTFEGENSLYGDFGGLDDLYTERPRVVEGMIEIYGGWIDRFGIDGFRIDTARHVNPGFWQRFVPAMLERARAAGIPNFHIFGEVASETRDPGYLAQYTRRDGFPSVLDFGFMHSVRAALGEAEGTDLLASLFAGDVLYAGGEEAALNLQTFLGNHDNGRFSTMLREDMPAVGAGELLRRVMLGHAMLLTLRGSPVIYSGDEQGFVGDGNDQAAREDMFASRTASYNDNDLLGTEATTAQDNFDTEHPLYRLIARLAAMRAEHAALRRGRQVTRSASPEPGLFAVTRFDPENGREYLLAFNTSDAPLEGNVVVETQSTGFTALLGDCPALATAPGSARLRLPALGYAVCRATRDGER